MELGLFFSFMFGRIPFGNTAERLQHSLVARCFNCKAKSFPELIHLKKQVSSGITLTSRIVGLESDHFNSFLYFNLVLEHSVYILCGLSDEQI